MSATPRRILYVEGNLDGTIGGSFFSLLFLVSNVDRTRYEPIVAFAAENGLLPRFAEHGIRTLIVRPTPPVKARSGVGRLLAKARNYWNGRVHEPARLARLMRDERIELLHLNNSIATNHAWMFAARRARIPCITHERGINERFRPRSVELGARLGAIICISAAVEENFQRLGLGRLPLVRIHNGLDPDDMRVTRDADAIRAEFGIAASARLIGIVGNIREWKGQEVVIRAVAELRRAFPDVVCLLIGDTASGDSAYRARIDELIGSLGLRGAVIITGYRKDVANYVNALEIQVHASVAPEPFGRVLLEAMALGKPLVASGGGAVPEIVVDGETGLLFEPGNAAALAAALQRLLGDPALARRMGAAGRARLEAEFSIARNVQQTEHLYRKLLG